MPYFYLRGWTSWPACNPSCNHESYLTNPKNLINLITWWHGNGDLNTIRYIVIVYKSADVWKIIIIYAYIYILCIQHIYIYTPEESRPLPRAGLMVSIPSPGHRIVAEIPFLGHTNGSLGRLWWANQTQLSTTTSWWLNQPISKNMLVKMGSSSPRIGVNTTNIWVATTRWAPSSYKWSYNSYKWPKING